MKKTGLTKRLFSAIVAGTLAFSAAVPIYAQTEESAAEIVLGLHEFSSADEITSTNTSKAYVEDGKLVTTGDGTKKEDGTDWTQAKITLTGTDEKIKALWNAQTDAVKKIRYEFDIKLTDSEGKRKFGIFLDNGDTAPGYKLQILGISEDGTGVGFNDMWGGNKQIPIPEFLADTVYHYSYELDITNKTTRASLSDETNTYESGVLSVDAGDHHWDGWWSNDLITPMNGLCFMNITADRAEIDNLKITQVRDELAPYATWDDEGKISVQFKNAVNPSTATTDNITLKKGGATVSCDGTLSADGKTYTMTLPENAACGEYTLTVSKAVKPSDTAYVASLAEDCELTLDTKNYTLGFHDFTNDTITRKGSRPIGEVMDGVLKLGNTETEWAATTITLPNTPTAIKEYWNGTTAASKKMKIEFDINVIDADGVGSLGINLINSGAASGWLNGMALLSVRSAKAGVLDKTTYFTDGGFKTGTKYHYSATLDIVNKKMSATLSSKDTTYTVSEMSVSSGDSSWPAWWKNADTVPFDAIGVFNASFDSVEIDNLRYTALREQLTASASADTEEVSVKFNYAVDSETATSSNITLKKDGTAVSCNGTLSADGKTYTMTLPADAASGDYTLTVSNAVKPAEPRYVAPLAKAYETTFNISTEESKDYVIGFHNFENETITRKANKQIGEVKEGVLKLGSTGSDWAGTNIILTDTPDAIAKYWNGETTAPKKLKLEFDIKFNDADSAGSFGFNLLNRDQAYGWAQGVCVLNTRGTNIGWLSYTDKFSKGGLQMGVTYHYTLNLNVDDKTASATLTSGNTTYTIPESSLAGGDEWGTPFWKPTATKVPLDAIGVFNGGYDSIEIDNLKYTVVRDELSASTLTAGDEVKVKFNYAVSTATANSDNVKLTKDGEPVNYTGSLSTDGKTYTMTLPEEAVSGNYEVSVATAVKPTDKAYVAPMAEAYEANVNVTVEGMEGILLGKYTFDGSEKITITGANKATVADGKLNVELLSGDYNQILTYVKPDDAADAIADFWAQDTSASRKLKVEFDFNATDADESGQCNILFTNYAYKTSVKDWIEGLNILSVSGTNAGYGNMNGGGGRITDSGFKYNTDYHYSMELDIDTKVANFVITDGTNTYTAENVSVAGEDSYGDPWWKPKTIVPFDSLTFLNPGVDSLKIDNLTFTQLVEKPSVSADNIKILENDKEQTEWTKVSPMSNKITIDFKTQLNEDSLNGNIYLLNKKTNEKVDATGALNDTVYTLSFAKLDPSGEYTLVIKGGIKNIAAAKIGTDYSYDIKATAGEVKASVVGITKDGESVTALSSLAKNDAVKINISYENSTGNAQTFYAIVAYYDGTALVKADLVKIDKTKDITSEEIGADYTVPDYGTATKAKIMCWENFASLRPLGESKDF